MARPHCERRKAVGFLDWVTGQRRKFPTDCGGARASEIHGVLRGELTQCAGDLLEEFGADRADDDDVRARSARCLGDALDRSGAEWLKRLILAIA